MKKEDQTDLKKEVPDYIVFGYNTPEEWAQYKEFQQLMKGEEFDNYPAEESGY